MKLKKTRVPQKISSYATQTLSSRLIWQTVTSIIIISMIIGGGIYYYWQNTNQSPIINEPGPSQPSSLLKLLLLDKINGEITSFARGSSEKSLFYKIADSGIKDAKYKKGQLVYIKTAEETDSLISVDIKADTKQEMDNKYHGYSCQVHIEPGKAACVDNQSISKISEISPNAYYVTYWAEGWEQCSDIIKNLENKSELLKNNGCGTTKWSPDGKRMAVFSEAGLSTGNRLALTQKGDIEKIVDLDFDKMQGDIDKIKFSTYQGRKYLLIGITDVDFINSDKIVFLGRDLDAIGNPSSIFTYDDSKNELKYIKTLEKSGDEYFQKLVYLPKLNSVLINSQHLSNTDIGNIKGRFFLVNLATGAQKEVATNIIQEVANDREASVESMTEIEGILSDGKTVVLSVKKTLIKSEGTEFVAKKTFSLDLEKNQYTILSENKEVIYIGFVE